MPAIVRPDVVLFGERAADCEKLATLLAQSSPRGSTWSSRSAPAACSTTSPSPIDAGTRTAGVPTVEINPECTPVSHLVDIKISGAAAEVLDDLWDRYQTWCPWV